jgi:peptidoglycan hydrolase-like protein with peptidoglycan-binding domain
VVDKEASLREETVPAVYKTVSRQVIDVAASTREVEIAAQYQTLSQSVKVSDATEQWRSILCETNATPTKIIEIQQALSKAGYNPGPMDGVIRSQTMNAVNSYQTAKGLPVDAYLNLETVKSLGVSPR